LFVERRRLEEIPLAGRLPHALEANLRERGIETAARLLEETAPIAEADGSAEKQAASQLKKLRLLEGTDTEEPQSPRDGGLRVADRSFLVETLKGLLTEVGVPQEWLVITDQSLRLAIQDPRAAPIRLSQA